MDFLVQVLHFKKLSESQRKTLRENGCRYIGRLNLWLFEGLWDLEFEDLNGITNVGEVILEGTVDVSAAPLCNEVASQLGIDPKLTYDPEAHES